MNTQLMKELGDKYVKNNIQRYSMFINDIMDKTKQKNQQICWQLFESPALNNMSAPFFYSSILTVSLSFIYTTEETDNSASLTNLYSLSKNL